MNPIEVSAELARLITGRCGRHGCDLNLVRYIDDGADSILDVWECPQASSDPELKAALLVMNEEADRQRKLHRDSPSWRHPEGWGPEWDRVGEEVKVTARRCPDSWVLIIPVG